MIGEPQVGQVIRDLDSRGTTPKRIMEVHVDRVLCRAGYDGRGRQSRIRRDRLKKHYMVIRDAPAS